MSEQGAVEAGRIDALKGRLKGLLNREPEVEKLKNGKFIAKYVEYGMSPKSLVASSEEEALERLLGHLMAKGSKSL